MFAPGDAALNVGAVAEAAGPFTDGTVEAVARLRSSLRTFSRRSPSVTECPDSTSSETCFTDTEEIGSAPQDAVRLEVSISMMGMKS